MAYQLNWSVTAFPKVALPRPDTWIEELKAATEADGVRILELRAPSTNAIQMFVSTQPHLSPAAIVASLKGRLQYLVRHQTPKAFRRNYRIDSVGDVNTETLGRYVGKQTERHPMADHRLQQCLEKLQFHDPNVDLNGVQTSSSGQFIHNLHGVIENSDGWHEWREQVLTDSRDMILRSSRAKKFRLSRIGLVSNHIHVTLGCGISDDPQTVALGFLNNLAFVQEMRPVFKFSYYIGTFGNYDRQAIRRQLGGA
jgi:REP element-mobilizing transposase RayT